MTGITLVAEVLQYSLPAILVLLGVWLVAHNQRMQVQVRKQIQLDRKTTEDLMPLVVSAHERLILLLERISPPNLVFRLPAQGRSSLQYQQELLTDIRNEFEHNLAQQLYVSDQAWLSVVQAREEIIRVVHEAAHQVGPEADALALSRQLLEQWGRRQTLPTQQAIAMLKNHTRQLFPLLKAGHKN